MIEEAAQLARNVGGGHVEGQQARRVEFDPHFAGHAAHLEGPTVQHRARAVADEAVTGQVVRMPRLAPGGLDHRAAARKRERLPQ